MRKLSAPHAASVNGRAYAPAEIVEVTDGEAHELFAHGFREADGVAPEHPTTDDIRPDDIETLSRKEMLKRLRGTGAGNLFVMSTEDLRALLRRSSA